MQFERHVANGAHVAADVLTSSAIATGRTTHQQTVLVQQADGQAIELGFAAVLHFGATAEQVTGRQLQPFTHAAVEVQQVAFLEGVAQAEHWHFMPHLTESTERCAADPLSRRIRRDQLRMRRLQRFQFVVQAVVFGIRNARLIQYVVTVTVQIQIRAQCKDAGGSGGVGHGSDLSNEKSSRGCSFCVTAAINACG